MQRVSAVSAGPARRSVAARAMQPCRGMATIRRSISIHAPVDRVFDYIADPMHLPEVWPSLVEVRNVEDHETGKSFDWDYKLLGVRIHGHSDPVERVPNERLVSRSVRGIPNTF